MCPSSSFAQRERVAGRRMAKRPEPARRMATGGVSDAMYPEPETDSNYDVLNMIKPPENPLGINPIVVRPEAAAAPPATPAPARLPHEMQQDKEAEWLLTHKQPNPSWWRTLAGAGTQFFLGRRSPAAGAALSSLITDSDPNVRAYNEHARNLSILGPLAKGEREDINANARWQQAQNAITRQQNIDQHNAVTQGRLADAAAEKQQNDMAERLGHDYQIERAETTPPPMQDVETAAAMPSMPGPLRAATPQTMQVPAGAPVPKPGPAGSIPGRLGSTPVNYVKRETMHRVTDKEAEAIGQPDLAGQDIPQKSWEKLAGSRNTPKKVAVGQPDTRMFESAARRVAAKHNVELDPDSPAYEQLPLALQQEATDLYENRAGGMDKKRLEMEAAAARMEAAKNKPDNDAKKAAYKAYEPSLDAAERFNIMSKNYQEGLKGNQQAMVSLLMNHIGMTLGAQKGARVTKDVIHEAAASLPWLERVTKSFDPNTGLLSGITLSPEQMKQMLALGRERFAEEVNKSKSQSRWMAGSDAGPDRVPSDATLDHYMQLAGGDVAKAQQLAAADGWTMEEGKSRKKSK